MARLPQVGGDAGNWGQILNEFLLQSHNADGTIAPGAVNLAKDDIGLENVDNTSDANKPISTAVQSALDLKADTSTINSALANKADASDVTAALSAKVNTSSIGVTNGIAALDGTAKVPDSQLPTRLSDTNLTAAMSAVATPQYIGSSDITGTVSLASITKTAVIQCRLVGNVTISSLPPSPIAGQTLTLVLTQDTTGSRTLTLPASVKKAYGLSPVLSTAAGAIDILHLFWDGVSWHVFVAGLGMA